MKKNINVLFLLFILIGCVREKIEYVFPSERISLQKINTDRLLQIIEDPLTTAHWGISVYDAEQGRPLYLHNQNKLFTPASNEKIITAASAINFLGKDFQFETTFCKTGEIRDSILIGDIVISGNGDPTINKKRGVGSYKIFSIWADSLKKYKIKKIDGNIVLDVRNFSDYYWGNGWCWDDLMWGYSSEYAPLQCEENAMRLWITPSKSIGKSVNISAKKNFFNYNIINKGTTVDSIKNRILINRGITDNNFYITGEMKKGSKTIGKTIALKSPVEQFREVFREVISQKNIEIAGKIIILRNDEIYNNQVSDTLFVWRSAPLTDFLPAILAHSDNLYSESLLMALSLENANPAKMKDGIALLNSFAKINSFKRNSYNFSDGSGLSRYNKITPENLTKILYSMQKYSFWKSSFAKNGSKGTLKRRFKNISANMYAKTGSMYGIDCLSGYLELSCGRELIFSIMVNNFTDRWRIRQKMRKIIETLIINYDGNYQIRQQAVK